jgi:hypothetical protein
MTETIKKKNDQELQAMSDFVKRYPQHIEFLWDQLGSGYDYINYSPSESSRDISKKDILFFFTQLYDFIDMNLMRHLTLFNKLISILMVSLVILFILLVLFLSYFMFYTEKSYIFYLCLFFVLIMCFVLIVVYIKNHIKVGSLIFRYRMSPINLS